MGRTRLYKNDVERKRAHRNRQRIAAGKPLPLSPEQQHAQQIAERKQELLNLRAMLLAKGALGAATF
jgi:hypothetical protein